MRKRFFISGIFLILSLLFVSYCESVESNGHRAGVMLGGTHFLGVNYEYHFYDNSIGLNLGIFDIYEIIPTVFYKRYIPVPYLNQVNLTPYLGIGIASIFSNWLGGIHLINVPIGLDWNFWRMFSIGLEFDINYILAGWKFNSVNKTFSNIIIEREFLNAPGIYAKMMF